MVESVTAPLAISLIAVVIALIAITRALRRRRSMSRGETESPTDARIDQPRSRKAG